MNRRSAEETKKRITEAAIKVFSQYGYNGATIRMIAKEAGLSVGAVYLYFKDKEELSLFLLKEKISEIERRIKEALQGPRSPLEALKRYLKTSFQFARENRELIIMHSKEQGFTFGLEIKREFFKKEMEILKGVINEGIKSGDFRECNPEEVAKLIMMLIRGFVLSVVVAPENLLDENTCFEIVLNGILKNKEV